MSTRVDVAVLAGGRSAEHEVSMDSGGQVLAHLDRRKWRPWAVHLDRDGRWWVPSAPTASGEAEPFAQARRRPLRAGAAIDHLIDVCAVELVFPVLHGAYGEDGTVQGLLELHDLAYVGAGVAASAVAMDKVRTRECLTAAGVPMARAHVFRTLLAELDVHGVAAAIDATVGFPCFLKVDQSGSTIGVARVADARDVAAFLAEHGGQHGRRLLAEELVVGEEVSAPVLGNASCSTPLEALPPIGIYPVDAPYFTYDAKYRPGACVEVVPPRGLDAAGIAAVQDLALRCHEALLCDGMSRTDLIVGVDGPRVLEVNTIPGLTRTSLLRGIL